MTSDPWEHPRPTLRREWTSLDGTWDFGIGERTFDREITVPYAPETPASGIGEKGRIERAWYRRTHRLDDPGAGHRLLVHFGAVDRVATVWANGERVGDHEGGYTSFAVDVTDAARRGDGDVELVVRADDPSLDLDAPRGKQEWLDEPHAIWYPRTTGIWRTVWVERVPETRIVSLRWTTDPKAMTVTATVTVDGPVTDGLRLGVRIAHRGRTLVDDTLAVLDGVTERTFTIGDRGLDDRVALLWWPRRPTLLDATVVLLDARAQIVDEVESYVGVRDVRVDDGHVLLNGRPYPLRFVLDQGYWPETGLTAPDPAALAEDIRLTKALGFNGARKHQKVEDPRYLAAADRAGLLVWVEMPSAYRFTDLAAGRLLREWAEVVGEAANHPSVVGYVPINESWGVPDLEGAPRQRALVAALTSMAHALDGTRPVSANDGWETSGGEIIGVHDYSQDPAALRERYGDRVAVDELLTSARRADGKLADLDRAAAGVVCQRDAAELAEDDRAATGGAGWSTQGSAAWGYDNARDGADLVRRYRELWAAVHESDALAGACWTQLTDTYQEVNGLLRFDRSPKAPLDELSAATRGAPFPNGKE